MKKCFRLLLCLVLCVFSITLFACGKNKGDPFLPSQAGEIASNGGLVVKAGDFLYFNNGFLEEKNQQQNKTDYVVGSLVATKLKNGQLVKDKDDFLDQSQTRYITQRLTSFEAGNIFICGNYIYFSSPCQDELKGGGGWARERVDFYRLHLNKSGKEERLYETSSNYSDVDFAYYAEGNDVRLVVKDGNVLNLVANGKVTKISDDFNSAYLAQNSNRVLYVTQTDSNYTLHVYNPFTASEQNKNQIVFESMTQSEAPTILYADNNIVYLKGVVDKGNLLACANVEDLQFKILYYDQSKNYNYSFYEGYVFAVNDKTISRIQDKVANVVITDSEATSVSVVGFASGMIIYVDGGNIKAVNCNASNQTEATLLASGLTILSENEVGDNYYDVIGNDFYFYNKVGSNFYLHRVAVTGNSQLEMVGIYEQADKPETEE